MSEIDGENSNQKVFSSVEVTDDLNKENLNLDVKNEETEDNQDILSKENIIREEEIRRKDEHIIELENKLRFYQSLEINQKAMENQLKEIELKSNCYLNELTDAKMKHEIEVKELKDKIEEISSTKNEHASFSNDMDQLIQLNISIIACEDDKDHDNSEENIKELTEKNSKLKKQIIKDKKLAKKLQEELEQIKNAFYELQSTSSLNYQQNSKELQILRDELIEKNEFINHLETENRQLEVQAAKASKEVENELVEQQIKDNQTDENEERSNEQNEQISQMHEDMRRLLEFKNELEALIEEQNKEIDHKNKKFNDLIDKNKIKDAENEKLKSYAENLEKQNKELKSKIAQYSSKIVKLKQGKSSESQKIINELNREVEILKEMVKSSKYEIRSKELNIKKFQSKISSIERNSKNKLKMSEVDSIRTQNSHKNLALPRQPKSREHISMHSDDDLDNNGIITEAEENLEATGQYDPIQMFPQTPKGYKFTKTPNIRMVKEKNNSKASLGLKEISVNSKIDLSGLKSDDKTSIKNKAHKFTQENDSSSLVLPVIKESHGAVILDKKRFELLKKDIDNSKTLAKVSNTYKQSFNLF